MDLVLIVRDGLASPLIGSLVAARQARERGHDVAVVVTGEALRTLVEGTFAWPRELAEQHVRYRVTDGLAALGVPVLGKGEGRQPDVKAFVRSAAEAGVAIFACPVWSAVLGLGDALPAGLAPLPGDDLAGFLVGAKQVVGAL